MKPRHFSGRVFRVALILLGSVLEMGGLARDISQFEGTEIPAPPAQSGPWEPAPTQLPPEAVRAMADLFTAGLADPRGCEYREIELYCPVEFGRETKDDVLAAHGWVLPSRAGDTVRYAVYWDGLVYPLISVGAPADPDAEVAKILREQFQPDQTLTKIPLLLRAGKTEAAVKLWNWWAEQKQKNSQNDDGTKGSEIFSGLATGWLRAAQERVMRPHRQSRPKLALAYLQRIPDFRTAVEKLAVQRGIELVKIPAYYRAPGTLDLTFLNQVPALLADEQRRVRENITDRDEEFAPGIIPDKKQRIALLIRDLEDVEAHQMVMPGYLDFGQTAVVQALVAQGEDAVDPLIDCLDRDQRFTRSVDDIRVVGVEEPALVALQGILKTTEQFAWLATPRGYGFRKLDRIALAAQIRQYWGMYRDKTLPQRWFGILADDSAEPDAWAEAAGDIVLAEGEEIPVGGFIHFVFQAKPGEVVRFRGESLRAETHPSVSELTIKRLRETLGRARESKASFPYTPPQKLAHALARWDGKDQAGTLRWYCSELRTASSLEKDHAGSSFARELIEIYLARARTGDPAALGEYAQWIRSAGSGKSGEAVRSHGPWILAPVWCFPRDPAIRELTAWVFTDPHSPWSATVTQSDSEWVADATGGPLLAVPQFRALILKQLESQMVVGKVERTALDQIVVTHLHGSGRGVDDPDAPPVGFKADLRWNDILALRISEIRGTPAFKSYWPVERRDQAIREIADFLRQYGGQLFTSAATDDREIDGTFSSYSSAAALTFSPLDHPATREDVAAGRAIFSLAGQGDRRVCPLPSPGASAIWVALQDYPSLERREDPVTKIPVTSTRFDQGGTVFQAEELLVDGKWRRFFGFVARNRLVAVPAEEVSFGSFENSGKMDGWEFKVTLAGKVDAHSMSYPATALGGVAVPVTVSVCNLRGIDRVFPKSASEARSASLDEVGLEVDVAHTQAPRSTVFVYPPRPDPKWDPVAVTAAARSVELLAGPGLLPPLKGMTLLQFDLAKWYDLKAPGIYAVTLKFTQGGFFDPEPKVTTHYLEITRP